MTLDEAIKVAVEVCNHDPYGPRAEAATVLSRFAEELPKALADLHEWRDNVRRNHPSVTESPIYHERVDRIIATLESR